MYVNQSNVICNANLGFDVQFSQKWNSNSVEHKTSSHSCDSWGTHYIKLTKQKFLHIWNLAVKSLALMELLTSHHGSIVWIEENERCVNMLCSVISAPSNNQIKASNTSTTKKRPLKCWKSNRYGPVPTDCPCLILVLHILWLLNAAWICQIIYKLLLFVFTSSFHFARVNTSRSREEIAFFCLLSIHTWLFPISGIALGT